MATQFRNQQSLSNYFGAGQQVEIMQHPTNAKIFFAVAGNGKKAYISQKVDAKNMNPAELQVVEVQTADGNWCPTIAPKGNGGATVVKTFTV